MGKGLFLWKPSFLGIHSYAVNFTTVSSTLEGSLLASRSGWSFFSDLQPLPSLRSITKRTDGLDAPEKGLDISKLEDKNPASRDPAPHEQGKGEVQERIKRDEPQILSDFTVLDDSSNSKKYRHGDFISRLGYYIKLHFIKLRSGVENTSSKVFTFLSDTVDRLPSLSSRRRMTKEGLSMNIEDLPGSPDQGSHVLASIRLPADSLQHSSNNAALYASLEIRAEEPIYTSLTAGSPLPMGQFVNQSETNADLYEPLERRAEEPIYSNPTAGSPLPMGQFVNQSETNADLYEPLERRAEEPIYSNPTAGSLLPMGQFVNQNAINYDVHFKDLREVLFEKTRAELKQKKMMSEAEKKAFLGDLVQSFVDEMHHIVDVSMRDEGAEKQEILPQGIQQWFGFIHETRKKLNSIDRPPGLIPRLRDYFSKDGKQQDAIISSFRTQLVSICGGFKSDFSEGSKTLEGEAGIAMDSSFRISDGIIDMMYSAITDPAISVDDFSSFCDSSRDLLVNHHQSISTLTDKVVDGMSSMLRKSLTENVNNSLPDQLSLRKMAQFVSWVAFQQNEKEALLQEEDEEMELQGEKTVTYQRDILPNARKRSQYEELQIGYEADPKFTQEDEAVYETPITIVKDQTLLPSQAQNLGQAVGADTRVLGVFESGGGGQPSLLLNTLLEGYQFVDLQAFLPQEVNEQRNSVIVKAGPEGFYEMPDSSIEVDALAVPEFQAPSPPSDALSLLRLSELKSEMAATKSLRIPEAQSRNAIPRGSGLTKALSSRNQIIQRNSVIGFAPALPPRRLKDLGIKSESEYVKMDVGPNYSMKSSIDKKASEGSDSVTPVAPPRKQKMMKASSQDLRIDVGPNYSMKSSMDEKASGGSNSVTPVAPPRKQKMMKASSQDLRIDVGPNYSMKSSMDEKASGGSNSVTPVAPPRKQKMMKASSSQDLSQLAMHEGAVLTNLGVNAGNEDVSHAAPIDEKSNVVAGAKEAGKSFVAHLSKNNTFGQQGVTVSDISKQDRVTDPASQERSKDGRNK